MQCRLWLNSVEKSVECEQWRSPYLARRSDSTWKNSTVYLWLRFITVTSWIVKPLTWHRPQGNPPHIINIISCHRQQQRQQQQQWENKDNNINAKLADCTLCFLEAEAKAKTAIGLKRQPQVCKARHCAVTLTSFKRRHGAHASYSWVNDGSNRHRRRRRSLRRAYSAHTSKS